MKVIKIQKSTAGIKIPKLCMDRLLPVSYFEKDKDGGGRGGINISITGVGGEKTVISGGSTEPVAEGEYTEDV